MKSSTFAWILVIFLILILVLLTRHRTTYEFLFENPLGAIVLVFIVWFALYVNTRLGIYVGFVVGLFFLLAKILQWVGGDRRGRKEGFSLAGTRMTGRVCGREKYKWSKKTIDAFLALNVSLYRRMFDVDTLQCQASEEEAVEFLKTNLWPWTEQTKQGYQDVIRRNTMLRTDLHFVMEDAMGTYTNSAMQQLIYWNTPEGKLLLEGRFVPGTVQVYSGDGAYGLNSGLQPLNQDIIRCGANGKMIRLHNVGTDGITGAHLQKVSEVDYMELPKLLPGFSWGRSGACNPCENLENPPYQKCKFSIPPPKNTLIVETDTEKTPWTVSWL